MQAKADDAKFQNETDTQNKTETDIAFSSGFESTSNGASSFQAGMSLVSYIEEKGMGV